MRKRRSLTSIAVLFLGVVLAMPAYALRVGTPVETGLEEDLARRLGYSAGLEEPPAWKPRDDSALVAQLRPIPKQFGYPNHPILLRVARKNSSRPYHLALYQKGTKFFLYRFGSRQKREVLTGLVFTLGGEGLEDPLYYALGGLSSRQFSFLISTEGIVTTEGELETVEVGFSRHWFQPLWDDLRREDRTAIPKEILKEIQDGLAAGLEEVPPVFEGQIRYYPPSYDLRGGWKLHLRVAPENYQAVHEWLWRNTAEESVGYKHLAGGEPDQKDFTVYVGDKKAADASAWKISVDTTIQSLLKEPGGDILGTDLELAPGVWGRFEIRKGRVSGFGQYGSGGIPYLTKDWYATIHYQYAYGKKRTPEQIQQDRILLANLEPGFLGKAFSVLADAFGEYFTGGARSPGELISEQRETPSAAGLEERLGRVAQAWEGVAVTPSYDGVTKRMLPVFYDQRTLPALPIAAKAGPVLVFVTSQVGLEEVRFLLQRLAVPPAHYQIRMMQNAREIPRAFARAEQELSGQFHLYPVNPQRPDWLEQLLAGLEEQGHLPVGDLGPAMDAARDYFQFV